MGASGWLSGAAATTNGSVFASPVNWSLHGIEATTTTMVGPRTVTVTTYTAGIWQGVVIMLVYLIETVTVGLWLFAREEFT